MISRNDGFSLLEVLIALGILVLVLAGSGTLLDGTSEITKFVDRSARRLDSKGFAVHFVERVEATGISSVFLNLPVPTGCEAADRPCVRSWDGELGKFISSAGLSGELGESVQFFSDREGRLSLTDFDFPGSGSTQAVIQTNQKLLNSVPDGLYVTWPLTTAQSAPFAFLTSGEVGSFLTSAASLATSKKLKHDYVFFEANEGGFSAEDFSDRIILVYNSRNPEVYTVKYVRNAKVCEGSETTNSCLDLARTISPKISPKDLKGKVALEVLPLRAPHFLGEELLPKLSQLGLEGARHTWKNQTGEVFLYPTDVASLSDDEARDFEPAGVLDLRNLQHYFHAYHIGGDLIATPIRLILYRLEANSSSADTYDLVSYTFAGKTPIRVMEIKGLKGPVVFSRELGTNSIQLYLEEES